MPEPNVRPRYLEPGWLVRNVLNRLVAGLSQAGINLRGSRVLRVRGRQSGEWRSTPVNLLEFAGASYLVSPRGETQWVRNLRAAGGGELRIGRRSQSFRAEEVADEDKIAVLRAYLARWRFEVGVFFGGTRADAPDAEFRRIAGNHPVFRIEYNEVT